MRAGPLAGVIAETSGSVPQSFPDGTQVLAALQESSCRHLRGGRSLSGDE
jgi:hypothetical protein